MLQCKRYVWRCITCDLLGCFRNDLLAWPPSCAAFLFLRSSGRRGQEVPTFSLLGATQQLSGATTPAQNTPSGRVQSLILHRRRGCCSFRVQLVAARHTARQKWLRARLDTKRTGRASSLGARTPCEMRHDVGYGTGERRRGRNGDIPGRFHPASGRRLHSNSSLAETGLKTSLALARK